MVVVSMPGKPLLGSGYWLTVVERKVEINMFFTRARSTLVLDFAYSCVGLFGPPLVTILYTKLLVALNSRGPEGERQSWKRESTFAK